jgi:phosphoribosylaminoimidazole-succinocarboxamide synthase
MVVRETNLQGEGVQFVKRGKVRDIYTVDGQLANCRYRPNKRF